jgi:hypothetical protein
MDAVEYAVCLGMKRPPQKQNPAGKAGEIRDQTKDIKAMENNSNLRFNVNSDRRRFHPEIVQVIRLFRDLAYEISEVERLRPDLKRSEGVRFNAN